MTVPDIMASEKQTNKTKQKSQNHCVCFAVMQIRFFWTCMCMFVEGRGGVGTRLTLITVTLAHAFENEQFTIVGSNGLREGDTWLSN